MNNNRDSIVYGSFNDVYVVFLIRSTAEYYASIHECHQKGIKLGELQKKFPWLLDLLLEHKASQIDFNIHMELPKAHCNNMNDYWDALFNRFCSENCGESVIVEYGFEDDLESFRNFYENELDQSERLPIKTDVFNEEFVYSSDLLDFMDYEPRMDWVPEKIIEHFGENCDSMIGGESIDFNIADTEDIIKTFEEMGYECVRDDKLVAKAYGE